MNAAWRKTPTDGTGPSAGQFPAFEAPFLRAPEGAKSVLLVTLAAACGPLLAGLVFFGWRAGVVATIAVASCVVIERVYYRVSRQPSLMGRSHAYLTGLLLGLTLPPFAGWYVPVIAAAFAIIVGKAIFGGVGHFLWQPALVGRLAVAVLLAPGSLNPDYWPVLARSRIASGGDIMRAGRVDMESYRGWRAQPAAGSADALNLRPPRQLLAGVTRGEPEYSGLSTSADMGRAKPGLLTVLPPIEDLLYGGYGGSIGETSAVIILVAGLYLIYRNYVRWQLPLAILASAWIVAAIAPIRLAGPNNTIRVIWWPLLHEQPDVGITYVNYQLLGGELFLAAFFFATEMTSRPVTAGGQAIFGLGIGALAMILQLYVDVPIPAYMAVLAMNTFTPLIDALWRPRVLGMKWWQAIFRR
jgi:electron transport complex protein RnfD